MDTRLVVYRKEAADSAYVTPFELDLDKAPNIRVNYNFLDLKNPENRKSNFTQTIKIPFTNNNNKFFENWFDVNLDTLVYNTKTKFKAVVLVDSVPQLEGYIQLKSIYLNARKYEVVVFGDVANLFSDIKTAKLREAFMDADGVIDGQLDHYNTAANVVASWTTPGLTTIGSTTTNDVVYPIIDYGHTSYPLSTTMFWNSDTIQTLGDPITENWNDTLSELGAIRVSDLKPAIRLQKLLHIIIQKAGYSIKSSFLGIDDTDTSSPITDTQWFSRLFMTLAPQYEKVRTRVFGNFKYTANSQAYSIAIATPPFFNQTSINWNNVIYDPNNLWSTGDTNTFTISYNPDTPDVLPTTFMFVIVTLNVDFGTTDSTGATLNTWHINSQWKNLYYNYYYNQTYSGPITTTNGYEYSYLTLLPVGTENAQWELEVTLNSYDITQSTGVTASATINSATIRSLNVTGGSGYTNGSVNAEVIMAENMPDVTQADFIKDILNRFNLIIQVDKDNPKLLLVEPYEDFMATGETKYWTDKLDVSKEQVIKSTNEMQSKNLIFSDLEDKDYFNDSYKKQWNSVWGSREVFNRNDFAKGDFKNFSIHSPFIANGAPHQDTEAPQIALASQYEIDSDGSRKPITGGKSKLFYYSGTPIDISGYDPLNTAYNFSVYSGAYTSLGTTEVYSTGNKFPLCTQYNLDSLTEITSSTKIVNWEYYNPFFSTGFTVPVFGDTLSLHGFYYDYWSRYINQIYSDEARIMDCYLNLTEGDILSFNFADSIFIKNALWNVISIENYVVGGKETTKVRLLKVIEKLSIECNAMPYQFNDNGTITFVNPADTSTVVTVTNECCENLDSSWTFQQTNDSTGVGTCYHNLNNPTGPQEVEGGGVLSGIGEIVQQGGGPSMSLPMPIIGATQNTLLKGGSGAVQSSTFFMYTNTYGSDAGSFYINGINRHNLFIPQNSMVSLEIELMGTVQIDTTTPANVSKVGYYNYTTLLKNIQGTNSSIGLSGGILTKSNADSGFPTPTANFTSFKNDLWTPSISVSGGQQIAWVAKVKIFIQPIPKDSDQFRNTAIYQNGDGILFQDINRLEWN